MESRGERYRFPRLLFPAKKMGAPSGNGAPREGEAMLGALDP